MLLSRTSYIRSGWRTVNFSGPEMLPGEAEARHRQTHCKDKVFGIKHAWRFLTNESYFIVDNLTLKDLKEKRSWKAEVFHLFTNGTFLHFMEAKGEPEMVVRLLFDQSCINSWRKHFCVICLSWSGHTRPRHCLSSEFLRHSRNGKLSWYDILSVFFFPLITLLTLVYHSLRIETVVIPKNDRLILH